MAEDSIVGISVNSSLQKMGCLTMEPREQIYKGIIHTFLDVAAKHKNRDKRIKRKPAKLKQNGKYSTLLTGVLLGNVPEANIFTLLQSINLLRFFIYLFIFNKILLGSLWTCPATY